MNTIKTCILLVSDNILRGMFDPIASELSEELQVAIPAVIGALTGVIVIVWGIPLVKKIFNSFIK